jgi:hypothetical protein
MGACKGTRHVHASSHASLGSLADRVDVSGAHDADGWLFLLVQIRGANVLGVPVLATEQYPKALGSTCTELTEVLPPSAKTFSKTLFSMCTPEVEDELKKQPHIKQVSGEHV